MNGDIVTAMYFQSCVLSLNVSFPTDGKATRSKRDVIFQKNAENTVVSSCEF